MTDMSLPLQPRDYFELMARWLDMESIAEAQRFAERRRRADPGDLEKSGETLVRMVVRDHETGLGGRFLLTFGKEKSHHPLPWNRFRVGSPVVLSDEGDGERSWPAIVSEREGRTVQLAIDLWPDGDIFRIDLAPDDVTRKRQLAAMAAAEQARGRVAELRSLFLGHRSPQFGSVEPCSFPDGLNRSQQEAVEFALSCEDVAIIHGPPGTGKTTTIVELICQAVLRGERVLATAPSNAAVDNLVERLVASDQRVVRLGHPARVSKALRTHSLDAMVESHENMRIAQGLMREVEEIYRRASRYSRARPAAGARRALRHQARELKQEVRRLEQQAVDHCIDRADVVCGTTTLDDELLGERHFDTLVIDEACQSTEPGCWLPVLRSKRVIFAGDPFQLPPTVVSREAAAEGFASSLLERLMHRYGESITRRLDVQYRMHETIMGFSSAQFYDASLVADQRVATHLLGDLPHVDSNEVTNKPLHFFDTAGAGWDEELEPDGESKRNPAEGEFVLRQAAALMAAGLPPDEIAVIAPYAAQVRWLRLHADEESLEIDTVDGFQGREKEAVIISLVRSNHHGEIGFLADTRRMNVALTRARRKLIVIGDSATLGGHPFYADLLAYFEQVGGYHTVWEVID